MAKGMIIGVRYGNYTDKKSGEVVSFVELQTVKPSSSVIGHATENVYVSSTSPIYQYLIDKVGGKVSAFGDLIGYFLYVERTTKGYLSDLELGECKQDAFVFDF